MSAVTKSHDGRGNLPVARLSIASDALASGMCIAGTTELDDLRRARDTAVRCAEVIQVVVASNEAVDVLVLSVWPQNGRIHKDSQCKRC